MKNRLSFKVLFIGDIHGNDGWKMPAFDAVTRGIHIIFLGDYVDSFHEDPLFIIENLNEIVALKDKYPERVTLLLGNHDYAYMFGKTGISGFNSAMWNDYRNVFNTNWHHFELSWGIQGKDKYSLITHAGLTQWFYEVLENEINTEGTTMNKVLKDTKWKELPIHELINHFKDQSNIMWRVGPERGGIHRTGSILWADKSELVRFNYPGINQIVGHTPCKWIEQRFADNGDELYFIDSHQNEYVSSLMIEF